MIEKTERSTFVKGIGEAISYSIVLFACTLLVKVLEIIRDCIHFGTPKDVMSVIGHGLLNDISFDLNIAIAPVCVFLLFYLISKKIARVFFITFAVLLLMIHAALGEYFLQTLVPLGADLFGYSIADIKQTVGAAGVSPVFIVLAVFLIAGIIWLFLFVPKKIKIKPAFFPAVLGVFILAALGSVATVASKWKPGPEFSNSMALNKSFFFYNNCYQSFFKSNTDDIKFDNSSGDPNHFQYVNETAISFPSYC